MRPYEHAIFFAAMGVYWVPGIVMPREVAQKEAVLKAFDECADFTQETANFSTWLIRITINEARMGPARTTGHLYESMTSRKVMKKATTFPKISRTAGISPPRSCSAKSCAGGPGKKSTRIAEHGRYREVSVLRNVQHMSIVQPPGCWALLRPRLRPASCVRVAMRMLWRPASTAPGPPAGRNSRKCVPGAGKDAGPRNMLTSCASTLW